METYVTTSSFNNSQQHPLAMSAPETDTTTLLEGEAGAEDEENTCNAQPTIHADYCNDVKSCSALSFEIDSSLEFVDPFHDDWLFWPKQEDPAP